MVRSTTGVMAVTSWVVLLAVLTSPPPATRAVLVTLAGALAATLSLNERRVWILPLARTSLRVAVMDWPLIVTLQPLSRRLSAAVGRKPAGSVSVAVSVRTV